ncbi:MAG: HAD family hydrolase [Hyphomicrobiaceae bacterium]
MQPENPILSPKRHDAVIFDLDGVVTRTARLHAAAWKQMFDAYLQSRGGQSPFDEQGDYRRYVDGKPRNDGVRSFLQARGIELPEGSPDDAPEQETIYALGKRKNARFLQLLEEEGAEAFDSTLELIHALRRAGIRTAVVSASRNCVPVLKSVGALELFDAKVDGIDAQQSRLSGKPAPDMFLAAARQLGVPPQRAVVFEDALAGVEAGRAGGFALVIGVDRAGQAEALRQHGADAVVQDLAQVSVEHEASRDDAR